MARPLTKDVLDATAAALEKSIKSTAPGTLTMAAGAVETLVEMAVREEWPPDLQTVLAQLGQLCAIWAAANGQTYELRLGPGWPGSQN
jgi:hypothetical protein